MLSEAAAAAAAAAGVGDFCSLFCSCCCCWELGDARRIGAGWIRVVVGGEMLF